MVSVSGAQFNEPSSRVPALLTTVGSTSANAEDAGSIGRRNNCFILWHKVSERSDSVWTVKLEQGEKSSGELSALHTLTPGYLLLSCRWPAGFYSARSQHPCLTPAARPALLSCESEGGLGESAWSPSVHGWKVRELTSQARA
ncbi:unnamed protein product [Rangifer tarandus platyrhynchus]|uniref:Uncharacterized protein n=1 Tax=Rangifer tarandus platyrhynchus TaxID=3082113 RepID=A0AC60A9Q7_RANTA